MSRPAWTTMLWGLTLVATCAGAEEDQIATVTASAYNSTVNQTDERPHEAAWGDRLGPGVQAVAVSPDLLDLGLERGTEIEIEGLRGTWTVLDRTASRHRNRIDIYMGQDVEAAREWGVQEVTIRWSYAD